MARMRLVFWEDENRNKYHIIIDLKQITSRLEYVAHIIAHDHTSRLKQYYVLDQIGLICNIIWNKTSIWNPTSMFLIKQYIIL